MLDILSPRDEDTAVIDPTHIFLKLPHSVVLGNNCRITIPEGAYIQLRRRPTEDEQSNARNM